MQAREIVLCYPVRTAIGTFNGTLKETPAVDLGAAVVRETVRRSRLDAASIGSVGSDCRKTLSTLRAEPSPTGIQSVRPVPC